MVGLFYTILRMSISASVIALIVMIARYFLRNSPKIYSYILWSAVLLRMICPFSLTLEIPVETQTEPLSPTVESEQVNAPDIFVSEDPVYSATSELPSDTVTDSEHTNTPVAAIPNAENPVNTAVKPINVLTAVWLIGGAAMLGYMAWSYISLYSHVKSSTRVRGTVFKSDRINTAFVLGVINPRVYIPSYLSFDDAKCVILHEQTHIRRGDHIVKIIAFVALAVHWFNPFIWLSYWLMSIDMEHSCDEAVIEGLCDRGYKLSGVKRGYGQMLISLAIKDVKMPSVAFSENDVKGRLSHILNYKGADSGTRRKLLILCAAMIVLCAFVPNLSSAAEVTTSDDIQAADPEIVEKGSEAASEYLGNQSTEGLIFIVSESDAMIAGYTGTDTDVFVPKEYNGLPVTSIGNGAFRSSRITSIAMPDSILTIGDEAFFNCVYLTDILWSQSLNSLGTYCFSHCESLRELNLPDRLSMMGYSCFAECAAITDIYFPTNLSVIPESCFSGCLSLTEVTIPNTVREISYHAFFNTPNLKEAHVISGPNLCSVMGFSENTAVNISYEVGYKGLEYELIDGKAYVTGYTYIPVDESAISVEDCSDTPIIPYIYEGCPVVGIADGAFSGDDCRNIRSMNISYGITQIGARAFSGCSDLVRIDIPTSLNNISPRAFDRCGDETVVMSYESEYLLMYFADKDVEYHQHGEYSFG